MSEVKKIATRESYGNALVELGKEHEDLVVLDADLAEATKTGMFKKVFPERHIDCGIAECNMIGVAAGIAATGKVPFASSFAMFAAGRAFEQVRNSVGYPKLNVKIGATHAGISVGEDGATHQCNEDIALMRTIPGMIVINPSDDVEAKAAVKAAYEHVGPVYLRFGRLAVPVINDNADYKFEIGKAITLREGTDVTIIATGLEVSESLAAAEKLAAEFGFPVILKAAAGGGGRGMRRCDSIEEVGVNFELVKAEAKKAFGNDDIFMEKFLVEPKHIEVQILGDEHGNIVHLYERDCSLQRRFQKVVEFTPAFSLPSDIRMNVLPFSLSSRLKSYV